MKCLLFSMLIIIPLMACANSKEYLSDDEYKGALQGDQYLQYNIGMNFLNGVEPFPQDDKEALSWLKKSANQGNMSAQNALGIIYVRGLEVPIDTIKAEYYFKLAAEQGHGNGQVQMGRILLKKGDAKSKEEAIVWLEKAAQQNNEQAIEILQEIKNSDLKKTP